MGLFARLLQDETAASSIEYAVLAAGIALVIIPVVNGLGGRVLTLFLSVSSALK
jgi:pilus assembly protein Flp/PilA